MAAYYEDSLESFRLSPFISHGATAAQLPLILMRSYLVFNQNHHCVIIQKRMRRRAAAMAILIEPAGRS